MSKDKKNEYEVCFIPQPSNPSNIYLSIGSQLPNRTDSLATFPERGIETVCTARRNSQLASVSVSSTQRLLDAHIRSGSPSARSRKAASRGPIHK